MTTTAISEIYASVQGEGPYTGEPQVFVRLAGCPLRCDYCDTPGSLTAKGHPHRSAEDVAGDVIRLAQLRNIWTVSLTGGEPLAHIRFLKELVPLLKKAGLRIYLETAGIHSKELREIVDQIDIISMDVKLPSATRKVHWREHQSFLATAGRKAFVKIVVEKHSTDQEFDQAFSLLSRAKPIPRLVLQPVSSIGPTILPPSPERLGDIYQKAKEILPEVLVMPQQHKIWGVR